MNNLPKVQKKNKKTNVSPFWAFAIEYKNELRRIGFPINNDRHLQGLAGEKWNKLSQEEKDKYKTRAKSIGPIVNKKRKLFNSLGVELEVVSAEQQKRKEEIKSMKEEIQRLVEDANDVGDLDDLVLHFLNATSFYEDANEVFPAEVALAKFSMRKGVFDVIQIQINPGKLPIGSHLDAEEKAKMHKYELPPNCSGETDYMEVLKKMIQFLHPMDRLPIFFSEGDDLSSLESIKKIVDKIFYESQEDDVMENLKFYPASEVFFSLKKVVTANRNRTGGEHETPFSFVGSAEDELRKNYIYEAEGCDYHKENDAQDHCALSKVRRYGYVIAKFCCDKIRYPMVEGRHFPTGYQD